MSYLPSPVAQKHRATTEKSKNFPLKMVLILALFVFGFIVSIHDTGVIIINEKDDSYNTSSSMRGLHDSSHDSTHSSAPFLSSNRSETTETNSAIGTIGDGETKNDLSLDSDVADRVHMYAANKDDNSLGQPMLVYAGQMTVRVKIDSKTIFQKQLDGIVNDMGKGYYQDRNFYSDSMRLRNAHHNEYLDVTIRVISKHFEDVIHSIQEIVESVESVNISSHDISSDFFDSKARGAILEASRDSLQVLMRKANSVEEVLLLQHELDRLNEQIESQRLISSSLKNQAIYSTINLEVTFIAETKPSATKGTSSEEWSPMTSVNMALNDLVVTCRYVIDVGLYFCVWIFALVLLCVCIGYLADQDDAKGHIGVL